MDRRKFVKLLAGSAAAIGLGYLLKDFLFKKEESLSNESNATQPTEPTEPTEPITQDTVPPSIENVSLKLTKEDDFLLNVDAVIKDDSGIEEAIIAYNYGDYQAEDVLKKLSDDLYVDSEVLPFDLNNLYQQGRVKIIAKDIYGNESYREKSFTFYKLLQEYDKQAPKIQDITLTLLNPSTLQINAYVNDDSAVKTVKAELSIDGTKKFLTLEKDLSIQNLYKAETSLQIKEQTITAKIVAKDVLGKESNTTIAIAYIDLLKQIDRQPPTITYSIEFISNDTQDTLTIEYTANDNVKLKNKEVKINGQTLQNLIYRLDTSNLEPITIEFLAEDLAGNIARETLSYSKDQLLKQLFQAYTQYKNLTLSNDQIDSLLQITAIKNIFKNYNLRPELETILNYYLLDPEKTIATLALLDQTTISEPARNKLYIEMVKHLQQEQRLTINQTQAKALKNYIKATMQGLTKNSQALTHLLNILEQEQNNKLTEFKPLTFKSIDGNDITLEPDLPRETYTLAEFLYMLSKQGINIANHPELHEAINMKIFANNWSIYDANYGINYYEKQNGNELRPDKQEVKDLIMLQWQHMQKFTPQFGDINLLYNRSFPWYNSNELSQLYPDETTRRQALFLLFFLPAATYNVNKQKIETGIQGAKTSIEQASYYYDIISQLYPDGKVSGPLPGLPDVNPKWYYYAWIVDRTANYTDPPRLVETGKQFTDMYANELLTILQNHMDDFQDTILQYNGIDQYLHKHANYGKHWDLAKFIMGYGRWLDTGIEEHGINYFIPDLFRYFGYPVAHTNIDPNPPGTANREWVITMPNYIIDELKANFGQENLMFGFANTFGLYDCKAGLLQDGVTTAYMMIPFTDKYIYLMKP